MNMKMNIPKRSCNECRRSGDHRDQIRPNLIRLGVVDLFDIQGSAKQLRGVLRTVSMQ